MEKQSEWEEKWFVPFCSRLIDNSECMCVCVCICIYKVEVNMIACVRTRSKERKREKKHLWNTWIQHIWYLLHWMRLSVDLNRNVVWHKLVVAFKLTVFANLLHFARMNNECIQLATFDIRSIFSIFFEDQVLMHIDLFNQIDLIALRWWTISRVNLLKWYKNGKKEGKNTIQTLIQQIKWEIRSIKAKNFDSLVPKTKIEKSY